MNKNSINMDNYSSCQTNKSNVGYCGYCQYRLPCGMCKETGSFCFFPSITNTWENPSITYDGVPLNNTSTTSEMKITTG